MDTCFRQVFVAVWTVLVLTFPVQAQQSLSITDTNTQGLEALTAIVTLDSDTGTQGYVLAIGFDSSLLNPTEVTVEGTDVESVGAELVVAEILSGGLTLGVVLDAELPYEGQEIPAGSGTSIAVLRFTPSVISTSDITSELQFQDGVFNSPTLDNIIVQGGLSVGANDGLLLIDGTVTISPPPPDSLRIENGSVLADGMSIGDARVLLSNSSGPVQGFVIAVAHGGDELTLQEITLVGTLTEAVGNEFEVTNLYADGGTIGVVLDFQPPFEGQTIPTGTDNHIATYRYSCNGIIYLPDSDLVTPLTPINSYIGDPLLDNVIVVGGLSLSPSLEAGSMTCIAIEPPPEHNTIMTAKIDFEEDTGNYAYHGQTGTLSFCYSDPDDEIQGVTITICYDCDLTIEEGTFSLEGSIVEMVGAEYINHQVDDDCSDGESGEMVLAILLDALPPFEGQTLPPTSEELLLGSIQITVDETAECNVAQEINFCDNINGNGSVMLYNNVVIDYLSVQDFERIGTSIVVVPQEIFQRGDCNSDDKVDLADSATTIASQFSGLPILCADACDANDDGIINLADAVFGMNWLFKFGTAPPDPGPFDDGPDPTEDMLPVCDSDDTGC
ncbi:MAG: hypothetical protein DSY81_11810 [Bacillota bacterium]|nr:MAG: hypothetical protein DSY92_06345 [Planctomycetota bacterium]RUA07656.1 MAG: hypothetical protein DSY81_11810 [Bacillota bacterium]